MSVIFNLLEAVMQFFKKYILGILIIIIGLLILFTPFGFAHVCSAKSDGSFMKCHWTGIAVQMMGTLIVFFGIIFCLFKKLRAGIAAASIGAAVCVLSLTEFVIGMCKNHTMPCNVYTKPVLILFTGLLIIVNAVYLFINRKDL